MFSEKIFENCSEIYIYSRVFFNVEIHFSPLTYASIFPTESQSTNFYFTRTFQEIHQTSLRPNPGTPKDKNATKEYRSWFSNSYLSKITFLTFYMKGVFDISLLVEDYQKNRNGFCSFRWYPDSAKTAKSFQF